MSKTKAPEASGCATIAPKTFAEEFAAENELLRRRFVHATRPRGPLTIKQAIALCQRMDGE